MRQRDIVLGGLWTAVSVGAGSAITAVAAPLPPPIDAALLCIGGGVACAGLSGVVAIALTSPNEVPRPLRGFLSVSEAGNLLYAKGNPRLRKWLAGKVPDEFNTITDHAAACIRVAAEEGICKLYAPKGAGLPLEELSQDEIRMNSFHADFEPHLDIVQHVYLKREKINAVRRHWEKALKAAAA